MLSDELAKLNALYEQGALSREEFRNAKERLLKQDSALKAPDHPAIPDLLGMTPSSYTTAMHLSQFAGYIVPYAGMVIPIALWVYGRDHNAFVEEHGKEIVNFIISYCIYSIVVFVLLFVLVGFILLPFFILLGILAPIFGAIAASKSQSFRYPLTFRFF
jgi:uncharacterized protein